MLYKTSVGSVNVIEHLSPDSKVLLLCIHGICSDARIFNYVGSNLSKAGISVISIDVLGHGKSDGEKGNPDFDRCLVAIDEIVKQFKKFKVFILAHSMGCTYALWYVYKYGQSVDGLILMAPYVRVKSIKKRSNVEPTLTGFLYILLRRLFTPNYKVKITEALPGFLNFGGDEVLQMLNDKELSFDYSYKYIIDVLARRNDNIPVLTSVKKPILVIHGKNDLTVFSSISEEFIKLLKLDDKEISILDSDHWFYDAIFYNQSSSKFTEESRQKVLKKIESWIEKHT